MTVDVTAIPNTGSRRRSHSIVPDRGDDYVLGGCQLTYNGTRLAVSGGALTIADGDTVYAVEINGTEFQPSSDGTVYVDVDPAGPSGDVVLQSSAPAAPALAIGSVDVSAGTTTELNRDPTLAARSFNTEDADITDLHTTGEVSGTTQPLHKITFSTEFVGMPFDNGWFDPMTFHRRHFDDGRYRVLVEDPDTDEHRLYSTESFDSLTLENDDLYPSLDSGGGTSFQDNVVLPDGTFVLYRSLDDTGTTVFAGSSLSNVSKVGTVVSGFADCGVYYESGTDTIHVYTESDDKPSQPTSDILRHYTTPADDLTNETRESDALDLTDYQWSTGDPEVIEWGGTYYMFTDNTKNHPNYHIALCASDDLYNWSVVSENISPHRKGGDMSVTRVGNRLAGITEYSGSLTGIGQWWLYPSQIVGDVQSADGHLTFHNGQNGEQFGEFRHNPSGKNFLSLHESDRSGGNQNGFELVDKDGNMVGRFQMFGQDPYFKAAEGKALVFQETSGGNQQFIINPLGSGPTEIQRDGFSVANFYDDGGQDIGAQDLSALSLGPDQDGRLYHHDGSNPVTLTDGSTQSDAGYYRWDNGNSGFSYLG